MTTTSEALIRLLEKIRTESPGFSVDRTRYLFGYNELRVGLETLCVNLADADVTLSQGLRQEIASAARELRVDKKYWSWLI